ncbi:site-2 protease family protein [Candidatus Saccharibacteria bacterium]|nr:site-2 protease family protein [Candidatus Saccharibacteria bacterium]
MLLAYLIMLPIAITVHEFMHAFTGYKLGDPTAEREGRLTLDPRKHIDPVMTILLPLLLILSGSPVVFGAARPVPFNPYLVRGGKKGAALVALAGPLTNLALALVVGLYLRVLPFDVPTVRTILENFVMLNLGFFAFNMIPFPPLDGSRVLYAFLPDSLRDLMDRIEKFGMMGIFIFLFLLYPLVRPVLSQVIISLYNLIV